MCAEQVKGIKDFIVGTCGVPANKFVGFRAPYLKHNEQFRNILQEQGYEYGKSTLAILHRQYPLSGRNWHAFCC